MAWIVDGSVVRLTQVTPDLLTLLLTIISIVGGEVFEQVIVLININFKLVYYLVIRNILRICMTRTVVDLYNQVYVEVEAYTC
jgi:hypothetical protein